MRAGEELEVAAVPLAGLSLVEASAGTGKTHAVTELYLRLVLEGGYSVDQILVVTYTKAATAELRARIRTRLVEALRVLREAEPPDEGLVRRLAAAAQGFDQAPIHTIHGFCQRALEDAAFEGGQPFERELVSDARTVVAEVVRDRWRREMAAASSLWAGYLGSRGVDPESLARWLLPHLGKPYLHIDGPVVAPRPWEPESAYVDALEAARSVWQQERDGIAELVLHAGSLNRNRYRVSSWEARLTTLETFLGAPCGAPARLLATKARGQLLHPLTPSAIAAGTKRGEVPPQHPFFGACERLEEAADRLDAVFEARRWQLYATCLRELGAEVRRRNRDARVQTYDDLLLDLHAALTAETDGRLATALVRRYPCALVDEFQDTDPVQLGIFRAIYARDGVGAAGPVFLVGDPKQAIYGFRGADVFAYLDGRRLAERRYTLSTNRRSEPGLVGAVNALFDRSPAPFALPEIGFEPALARGAQLDETLVVDGDPPEPLRGWLLQAESGTQLSKGDATALVTASTATEVARLLALSAAGCAMLGSRPLAGHDIAVLVRTNRQGALIQAALAGLGVRSVRPAQDNVFASAEAAQLETLLTAVARPRRESAVRAALATVLLGHDGAALAALAADAQAWDRVLEQVHHWRHLWLRHGVSRMLREVIESCGVAARALARPLGERQLTNLLHLGELLQRAEIAQHAGPEELLRWLVERRGTPESFPEEAEQRLESDAELVRIVTIHGAKGLQYPIVFCPFLWDARSGGEESPLYHDPERGHEPVINLTGAASDAVRDLEGRESLSESLRLLYVALTRARYRCYLAWGPVNQAEHAALAWLLGSGGLEGLALRAAGTVRVEPLPAPGPLPPPLTPAAPLVPLAARRFSRRLTQSWRVSSFTALTSDLPAELPDYDEQAAESGPSADPSAADALLTGSPDSGSFDSGFSDPGFSDHGRREPDASEFPRGARAGSCLHALLEQLDFEQPVAEQRALVSGVLAQYDFDTAWVPAASGLLQRTLDCPLERPRGGRGLFLAELPAQRRCAELEFYFSAAEVRVGALVDCLRRFGYLGASAGLEPGLLAQSLSGHLKGYVDLVLEHRGRYSIVDYKTHWLGPRPEDYAPDRLAEVIARERYELQFMIYLVALHRYLATRIRGYRYETHVGAVFYLFVRGMHPDSGPARGVFRHRPAPAAVAALDALLRGTPAEPAAAARGRGAGDAESMSRPEQGELWP